MRATAQQPQRAPDGGPIHYGRHFPERTTLYTAFTLDRLRSWLRSRAAVNPASAHASIPSAVTADQLVEGRSLDR